MAKVNVISPSPNNNNHNRRRSCRGCGKKRSPLCVPLSELDWPMALREGIKLAGLTLEEVAKRAFISPKTLENYLYDPTYENPSLYKAIDLGRASNPEFIAEWFKSKVMPDYDEEASIEQKAFRVLSLAGDLVKELSEFLSDGVLDAEEKRQLIKPLLEFKKLLDELCERCANEL